MSGVELRDAPMFVPSSEVIAGSQLTDFARFCERATQRTFADDRDFARFTVDEYERFWSLFLEWSNLAVSGDATQVCAKPSDVERAVFFPELRLSYFDSLLDERVAPADAVAVVACHAS
ncbi:MAG TPA: acetoacetate--CoA ligase, partial [Acidimicrobiia bacterium]